MITTRASIHFVRGLTLVLALLSAWGLFGLQARMKEWNITKTSKWLGSFVTAGVVTSLLMFVPVQLKSISAGVSKRQILMKKLEPQLYQDALVFVNHLVPSRSFATWAYTPPNPHPKLKETVLYVRLQYGIKGARRNFAFWKKHFPKRAAWVFYYYKGRPVLKKVEHDEWQNTRPGDSEHSAARARARDRAASR